MTAMLMFSPHLYVLVRSALLIIALMFTLDTRVHATKIVQFIPFSNQRTELEHNITLSDAMLRVQQTIKEMDRRPDCQRIAARRLAQACVNFDGREQSHTHTTLAALEKMKNAYAVRMTHCALTDALVPMPSDCVPLLDPDVGDDIPPHYLANCLSALSKHNTMWITFNQVKTEGGVICHSMRIEAEKDEQIHDLRKLFDAVKGMTGVVSESYHDLDHFRVLFEVLQHNITQSLGHFLHKMHTVNNATQSLEEILSKMSEEVIRNAEKAWQLSNSFGDNLTNLLQIKTQEIQRQSNEDRQAFEQGIAMLAGSLIQELSTAREIMQAVGYSSEVALKRFTSSHAELDTMNALALQLRENINNAKSQQIATSALTLHNMEAMSMLSSESLEATRALHQDLGQLRLLLSSVTALVNSYLGRLALWFSLSYSTTVLILHFFNGLAWAAATVLAVPLATAASMVFTFVMSPDRFITSLIDSHSELLGITRSSVALYLTLIATFFAGAASMPFFHRLRTRLGLMSDHNSLVI